MKKNDFKLALWKFYERKMHNKGEKKLQGISSLGKQTLRYEESTNTCFLTK